MITFNCLSTNPINLISIFKLNYILKTIIPEANWLLTIDFNEDKTIVENQDLYTEITIFYQQLSLYLGIGLVGNFFKSERNETTLRNDLTIGDINRGPYKELSIMTRADDVNALSSLWSKNPDSRQPILKFNGEINDDNKNLFKIEKQTWNFECKLVLYSLLEDNSIFVDLNQYCILL